uniref:Uncharacterized protein n=1 Tax=Rhizophora mucronata TaxID=61149 RepID=A0A2P2PGU4_RHIMU
MLCLCRITFGPSGLGCCIQCYPN